MNTKVDGSTVQSLPSKVAARVSFAGIGKTDGSKIIAGIEKAEKSMREILYKRACEFEGNEKSITEYLEGFGMVMGKVMKSQAKQVLIAVSINAEKMDSFKGIFSAWVKLARDIRAEQASGTNGDGDAIPPVPVATKQPKVTAKQHADISDKVPVMTKAQVEELLPKLATQLTKTSKNWENSIMLQIESLANALKQSEQPIYQNIGLAVLDAGSETGKSLLEAIEDHMADEAMREGAEKVVAGISDETTSEVSKIDAEIAEYLKVPEPHVGVTPHHEVLVVEQQNAA